MDWAATMDYMCEPHILKKTGKTVQQHQEMTIDNTLKLLALAPEVPWIPVIQGWKLDDYLRHVDQYGSRGLDLSLFPVVGVGSVCRRQRTAEGRKILLGLADLKLRIHGFGVKLTGLLGITDRIASADSMAWSLEARYSDPLPGHTHKNCANCFEYAMRWRARLLKRLKQATVEDNTLSVKLERSGT